MITSSLVFVALCGCAPRDDTNEVNGKALFVARCGACHTLGRAGTTGKTGPDLDAAFARARADGVRASTIAGIVEGQILHPRRGGAMPPGLVTDGGAEDVAAYVAQAAAVPGRDEGRLADAGVPRGGPAGRQLFVRSGCSGCHRLADAGSTGTTGPDLDAVLAGRPERFIRESIVDPDAVVADGFPRGVMPSDYERRLSKHERAELGQYLHSVTR